MLTAELEFPFEKNPEKKAAFKQEDEIKKKKKSDPLCCIYSLCSIKMMPKNTEEPPEKCWLEGKH